MTPVERMIDKLPEDTRDVARMVWQSLPAADRKNMQNLIKGIPPDTNLMRMLLKMSSTHLKLAFGQKHRVAIVGPANVGKSTFYNQLISQKSDQAKVSPIPGTTRVNQTADTGLFAIVDTPGADAAGTLGEYERMIAMDAAQEADFLIIMFDALQGVRKSEVDLYHELTSHEKPFVVVLNKIDLVKKDAQAIIQNSAHNLGLEPDQVIPISAKDGKNLSDVLIAITLAEPSLVAAIGQALPQYRWKLAYRNIVSAASISAVIALTPLPIIDFAPLLVTQSTMILGIARIYNYKINLKRARELVVTFGLGFLGRTLFYELSKFGGVPGWVLSVAIASSITVAMGYAAVIWFERGEKLTPARMKELTAEISKALLDSLKSLGKKKSNRKKVKEAIEEALTSNTIAENRSILDEAENAAEKK